MTDIPGLTTLITHPSQFGDFLAPIDQSYTSARALTHMPWLILGSKTALLWLLLFFFTPWSPTVVHLQWALQAVLCGMTACRVKGPEGHIPAQTPTRPGLLQITLHLCATVLRWWSCFRGNVMLAELCSGTKKTCSAAKGKATSGLCSYLLSCQSLAVIFLIFPGINCT